MEVKKINVNGSEFILKSDAFESLTDTFSTIDDQEYIQLTLDEEQHILEAIKSDGTKVINGEIESPTITTIKNKLNAINTTSYITFNLVDVDRITFIGSSQIEHHYALRGKDTVSRVSLLSDYNFESYSSSGNTFYGILNRLNNNGTYFGGTMKKYKSRFAMMCCYANDIKTLNVQEYKNSLSAFVETLLSMGTEPIITTQYHERDKISNVKSAYKDVAEKYGLIYADIKQFVDLVRGNKYDPFWNSSHAGSRTNAMQADNYFEIVKTLERPSKAIKIFRIRENINPSTLDDLRWNDNYGRGKFFKEIFTGHSYLTSGERYVDHINENVTQDRQNSEYVMLMDGEKIIMKDYALLSVVIPMYSNNTSSLGVKIENLDKNAKVYVKNVNKEPFFTTVNGGVKFQVLKNQVQDIPSIGSTYTSEKFPSVIFTINSVYDDYDGFYTLYAKPSSNIITDGGEVMLTKINGVGDDVLNSLINIPYDNNEHVKKYHSSLPLIGHWEEIFIDSEGFFVVENINNSVQIDKCEFLIQCDGSFEISNPIVKCQGVLGKTYQRKRFDNFSKRGNELLEHTIFGNSGMIDDNWKNSKNESLIPQSTFDNVYPYGVHSVIEIDDENDIQFKWVNNLDAARYDRELELEIIARYFPDVADIDNYDKNAHNYITNESYDYNELYINIYAYDDGSSENIKESITDTDDSLTIVEYVGTHYKIIRTPINISFYNKYVRIKLYSNNRKIQIARISLKEK